MRINTTLILATIFLVMTASIMTVEAQQSVVSPNDQNRKAYTPPKGDPERKALLDTLRKRWPSDMEVVFAVRYLQVKDGWAWIAVQPQSRDGRHHFEDESWLLQKVNGQWKEVTARAAGLDCEEDPDCADDRRFYKKLKKQFPDMPVDILPYSGEGKPVPSHAGKTILDYYHMIPAELLDDHKYAIRKKNDAYASQSVAGYEIAPLVMIEMGYLQIIDQGTGGGSITQDVSFQNANEGNQVLRVNLIAHNGVGPVCSLRFYTLDGHWTDVTSRYLPEINLSHFLDETYLARHRENLNLHPEGIVLVYEFREPDGPVFAHINLERFARVCPATPASLELVRNIKYGNVRLLWNKNQNALRISDKGYFDKIKQQEFLDGIEARHPQ